MEKDFNSLSPPHFIFPAVSVIIPMHNAEKYIGDCLDSILAQTFQDFEVIVVDDCSTDNSFAIAESYVEKFGGRMTLTKLKENSGNTGYTARNKGFTFSRGEYVFFIDADDFITKDAFEILYTSAKNFDADVVYTGARYHYTSEGGGVLKIDRVGRELIAKGLKNEAELTINDPHKYLKELLDLRRGLYHTPWTKFVRRNFLIEKEITFYETISGGDYLWTIEIFARAERFVRIPNAVYFWRDDSIDSMTRSKSSTETQIRKWGKIFVSWTKFALILCNKIKILRENPAYLYSALIFWTEFCLKHCAEERLKIPSEQVYRILLSEFENDGSLDLIIPILFGVIDSQQKALLSAKQEFDKTQKALTLNRRRVIKLNKELEQLKKKG